MPARRRDERREEKKKDTIPSNSHHVSCGGLSKG
jgi:hypothetical protein